MEHPDYCIYHRMVCHSTNDCWGLQTLFEKFMIKEAVELTVTKDVLRNPLLNHKDNKKAIMMVTISHHEENEEPTACEIANTEGSECPNFEESGASSLQNSMKFKWLFEEFGFSQATRFNATKAILCVAEEHGEQCMGLSSSVRKTLRNNHLPITFTEADR
ncbi:hypothetical protein RHMOL_Rhmol04G0183100 [Rhododendron molle]|uniref:Uncharacterized protein n=1 Tax=Rhododendron molle TaxID=49168 RepID=A0ACC0P310_RHOML|nr:hypothetical protein RHMOL_Rhmol04G0183100 [Rhododendron molle]